MEPQDISYIINHLGEDRELYFNAVSPPVIQSSNFCYQDVNAMRESLKREFEAPFYTRGYNPTIAILRKKLAALSNSEDALVFASGSAAIAAAVCSVVKAGGHVVCVHKPYSWTYKLLQNYLSEYGITTTMIDGTVTANWEAAIQANTQLLFLESPNSMTFELQDIAAVAQIAKKHGITTIMDNSYATPLNQDAHGLGIDIVTHSATKYLAGHSDVVAGLLTASKERIDSIFRKELMTFGGIISPHDAWLMLRSLRTLPLRLDRVAESTPKVVAFLENHPKVEKVIYPFSASHPQHELAKRQMKKPGGLFSILLKTKEVAAMERFCDNLQYFLLACSWGGHESLVFPVCAFADSINYDNPDLPINLIRLYVGLEEVEVLIEDLRQALDKI